ADAVLTEESLLKYALANEDLLEAFDIADDATELTDAQALALASQFYSHGYMESRPDAPFEADVEVGATFTLTSDIDTATANQFIGSLSQLQGQNLQTLNSGDNLTGTGDNPTLTAE